MQYIKNIFSKFSYNLNCGAIDVIVIEQPDGTFKSTPLRVVFGMARVIQPKHKKIEVRVNDVPVRLNLYLGDFGEVYCCDDLPTDIFRSSSLTSLDIYSEKPEQTIRHSSSETDIANIATTFAKLSQPQLTDDLLGQEIEYLGEEIPEDEPQFNFMWSLCGEVESLDPPVALSHFYSSLVTFEDFIKSPSSTLNNKKLVFMFDGKFYTWETIGSLLMSMSNHSLPESTLHSLNTLAQNFKGNQPPNLALENKSPPTKQIMFTVGGDSPQNSDSYTDYEPESPPRNLRKHSKPFEKLSRLSSSQIKSLNLRPGVNTATFSVTTSFQGTCTLSCRIFLWHYRDKLVVSDIDGTITKSDVFGQFLPMFGVSWCHDDVINMFRAIEDNKYRIFYLSSRSFAQYTITSQFIENSRQHGVTLPEGPIMLSPYGLFQAFNREVILKCPQEFKIKCLKEIVDLFPEENRSPIVGGFGNRDTDETTYRALGIPPSRIFIINSKGSVVIPNLVKLSTRYSTLKDRINSIFPYHNQNDTNDEYMASMYWRLPYKKSG